MTDLLFCQSDSKFINKKTKLLAVTKMSTLLTCLPLLDPEKQNASSNQMEYIIKGLYFTRKKRERHF